MGFLCSLSEQVKLHSLGPLALPGDRALYLQVLLVKNLFLFFSLKKKEKEKKNKSPKDTAGLQRQDLSPSQEQRTTEILGEVIPFIRKGLWGGLGLSGRHRQGWLA